MNDERGCSLAQAGEEQYEFFWSPTTRKTLVQYDYRTYGGRLFSCVRSNLESCRRARDVWLKGVMGIVDNAP